MALTNQLFPTRKEIISLAGRLPQAFQADDYFDKMEEAEDLLQQAYQTESNSKSAALAKKAFELNPLFSDSLLHVAQVGKLFLFEKFMYLLEALRISVAQLPPDYFTTEDFPFWLELETRPFMRALHCLGIEYYEAEMLEFSEFYLSFALDLNSNDNQGIRYLLVNVLLHQNKTKDAKVILEKYGDSTASFSYAKLLLGLLESATSEELDRLWDNAYGLNPYVPRLILNRSIPFHEGPYRRGDESEARAYVSYAWKGWDQHSDACKWLSWKFGVVSRAKSKIGQ